MELKASPYPIDAFFFLICALENNNAEVNNDTKDNPVPIVRRTNGPLVLPMAKRTIQPPKQTPLIPSDINFCGDNWFFFVSFIYCISYNFLILKWLTLKWVELNRTPSIRFNIL